MGFIRAVKEVNPRRGPTLGKCDLFHTIYNLVILDTWLLEIVCEQSLLYKGIIHKLLD